MTHLARSICRRAERSLVTLQRSEPGQEIAEKYLNRLSDLLFVLARYLNHSAGISDVLWNRQRDARQTGPAVGRSEDEGRR